jgi:hypothetical protein
MVEKTRLLQRGLTVSADHRHELGLATFPALPEHVTSGLTGGTNAG